jgi:hypothetical protein
MATFANGPGERLDLALVDVAVGEVGTTTAPLV